jgi:hypothetical protein
MIETLLNRVRKLVRAIGYVNIDQPEIGTYRHLAAAEIKRFLGKSVVYSPPSYRRLLYFLLSD